MNVISNNCCGGCLYRKMNIGFNNPFIWMVIPYSSLKYILEHFYEINWKDYEILKSKYRKYTFIILVDKKIEIHYIHYIFNSQASNKIINGTNVEWNKIWEYVVEKYEERVNRMLTINEKPVFLIRDEDFISDDTTIEDIIRLESPFKRFIITKSKLKRNDDLCRTLNLEKVDLPEPTINTYYNDIKNFLLK